MACFNGSVNVRLCDLVAKVQYSGLGVMFVWRKMLIKSSLDEKKSKYRFSSGKSHVWMLIIVAHLSHGLICIIYFIRLLWQLCWLWQEGLLLLYRILKSH